MSTTDDPFAEFDNLEPVNTSVENTPEASSNFIEVYSKDDHVNSLQEAMDKYDANLVNTQVIRQKLVDKLLPNVMHMDLGAAAESDPDLFTAQSKMIAETRNILNDMDYAANNHAALKLKHKSTEAQAEVAFNAAELLSKIKLNLTNDTGSVVVQDEAVIEAAIQKKFDDGNMVIPETELEEGVNMLPRPEENEE